jgi:hypothetical protein
MHVQTEGRYWGVWGMGWITFTVIALFDLAGAWLILRLWDLSRHPRSIVTYLISGALAGLTFVVLLGFLENDALLWQPSEIVSGMIGGIVAALCWFASKRVFKVKV